jgi:hypothetical protein
LSRVNIFGESPRALSEEGFGESKKKKFSAKIKTLGEEFLRRESKIFFAGRKINSRRRIFHREPVDWLSAKNFIVESFFLALGFFF